MSIEARAAIHAALGDPQRLRIVEALVLNDMTPRRLAELCGLESNLMAHHLKVLENAGLVSRRESAGDRRRRYVSLTPEAADNLGSGTSSRAGSVLFVCTRNSARSQFAEALLRRKSDITVSSAGLDPAAVVHPKALRVASENGLDLSGQFPKHYEAVEATPDLVVSVCDRAFETDVPIPGRRLHWSIPDPVDRGRLSEFRAAFRDISRRVDRLIELVD